MTITLTPITRSQWKEVFGVVRWVVIALACSAGIAYWDRGTHFLETIAPWLATPAVLNVVGFVGKQILTQEQAVAESHIPNQVEAPLQSVEATLTPPQGQ